MRRRRRPRPIATGRGRRLLARAERSGLARTVGFGERDGFAGGGGHGGRGEEKTQHTYKQAYNYSFRNRHTTGSSDQVDESARAGRRDSITA